MKVDSGTVELWEGWEVVELVDDTVSVDGITLHRTGITATSATGATAFGSAASLDGSPFHRAYAELVERAAIMEALFGSMESFPSRNALAHPQGAVPKSTVFPQSDAETWQFARSNGVASAATWEDACRRAQEELAERDALLRAWYAGTTPERIAVPTQLLPPTTRYDWHAGVLPTRKWAGELEVVMIFAFPRTENLPLLRGFGAATERSVATRRALAECLQSLAFLADEPLPTAAPDPSASPLYHMDSYLYPGSHGRLRDWLFGQVSKTNAMDLPRPQDTVVVSFADLTPAGAPSSWKVARALCDDALPLTFGDGPPWVPQPLRAHPIA